MENIEFVGFDKTFDLLMMNMALDKMLSEIGEDKEDEDFDDELTDEEEDELLEQLCQDEADLSFDSATFDSLLDGYNDIDE